MCVMSVVMEYAGRMPLEHWTPERYDHFKHFLTRVEEIDRQLGEPDCVDPEKATVLKRIEDRLASIERKLAQAR